MYRYCLKDRKKYCVEIDHFRFTDRWVKYIKI